MLMYWDDVLGRLVRYVQGSVQTRSNTYIMVSGEPRLIAAHQQHSFHNFTAAQAAGRHTEASSTSLTTCIHLYTTAKRNFCGTLTVHTLAAAAAAAVLCASTQLVQHVIPLLAATGSSKLCALLR